MLPTILQTVYKGNSYNIWQYNYNTNNFHISGLTLDTSYPASGLVEIDTELLIFILNGILQVNINNNERIKVVKGDIFLIPPNTKFQLKPYISEEVQMWCILNPSPKDRECKLYSFSDITKYSTGEFLF
jgi:mannose-6-phosphate isomerase-like protein (cupin superfamily)